MISTVSFLFCALAMALTILIPLAAILLYARKHPGNGLFWYWLLGAAGFFLTQIVIRVPILTLLQSQAWFIRLQANHLALFGFLLAFTAGLFELAGRFGVAVWMNKKNKLTFHRSIAAGLGHGGIEAIVLIGFGNAVNLAYMVMINAGTFDMVIAEAAQTGVDVSQLYLLKETLLTTSPGMYLLGVFERILAMAGHLGMSMLVCYGCHTGKPGKYAIACLLIHTFIDMSTVINAMVGSHLSQTTAYILIYTLLTAVAVASIFIVRRIHKSWPNSEVTYETA